MSCPKNPKKFLFFNYLGAHKPIITYVRQFGSYSWNKYECTSDCELCEVLLGTEIMKQEDLVALGFSREKIIKKIDFRFGADARSLR